MSGLEKISNQEIHLRLQRLVKSERKLTHIILLHIQEMQERRLYLDLGYGSAFDYLTKCLGYSESAAFRRLKSAQLLKQVPEISEKLEEGKINLSQLLEVQKAIQVVKKNALEMTNLPATKNFLEEGNNSTTKEISADLTRAIISKIESKNSFETKKILAQELNLPIERQDRINPQKDESVTVTLNFSKEQYELLKLAQSIVSHSCPNNSLQEVITFLAEKVVKRSTTFGKKSKSISSGATAATKASVKENAIIPMVIELPEKIATSTAKVVRNASVLRGSDAQETVTSSSIACMTPEKENKTVTKSEEPLTQRLVATPAAKAAFKRKPRKYISKKIKLTLLKHSRHQCEFTDPDTRQRCHSNYQLQIDHIYPHALGGSDCISNLRVLCGSHNRS